MNFMAFPKPVSVGEHEVPSTTVVMCVVRRIFLGHGEEMRGCFVLVFGGNGSS